MVLFSPARRALIVSLESAKSDSQLRYLFDTLRDASDRQLSGTRAGIVCAKLEGLTGEQLSDLGNESGRPTPLRRKASHFLNTRRGSHLVCLAFFSDGPVEWKQNIGVSRGGFSYFFENTESPLFHLDVLHAFRNSN